MDPRIAAALPRVRAYMDARNHQQKDVVELSKQSQSQVSKFLAGKRRRVTPPVRAICQYAEIDLDAEWEHLQDSWPLSQTARRVLVDNPRGAELLVRVIDALVPVLLTMRDAQPAAVKEAI